MDLAFYMGVGLKAIPTEISNVIILEPIVHIDNRGFLFESYRKDILKDHGIDSNFVQDNLSQSSRYTLRGLHYQLEQPQAKLCWVPVGAVLDVAVDVRKNSSTFGNYVAVELSSENHRMLYVPRGFAHGVLILEHNTFFQYKCDAYYNPHDTKGVAWDDPDLNINWGVQSPILSNTDKSLPRLKDIPDHELPAFTG